MAGRVVEALVALGVLASAGILALMLAAPLLPEGGAAAAPSVPATSPSSSAAPSAEPGAPPLGLFKLRGRLGVEGQCAGVELRPQAFPVAAGAVGSATVLVWTSPVSDWGNPQACDGRAGDLRQLEATVTRVADEDDPDGSPVGYALRFHLPSESGFGERDQEIVILAGQSSSDLIQALDMTTTGSGLVFERVAEIDPPLVPVPSPSPVALPTGRLFLLRGPLDDAGPCLVLDTGRPSDGAGERTGAVRWWLPGNPDLTDPGACLTRSGEVAEGPTEISTVTAGGDGAVTGYAIRFSLPGGDGSARDVLLELPIDQVTPDQLTAFTAGTDGQEALVFDRVDSIDPPLASPSP